jgi:hypothetical protein
MIILIMIEYYDDIDNDNDNEDDRMMIIMIGCFSMEEVELK